jgi:hypothetical protein
MEFGDGKVNNRTDLAIRQKYRPSARSMSEAKLFKLSPMALYHVLITAQKRTSLAE